MKYTKAQAVRAYISQFETNYKNVWLFISNIELSEESAEKEIKRFASKEGLSIKDIFESYQDNVKQHMSEKALDGFFDF
jgi:hypothetical protein